MKASTFAAFVLVLVARAHATDWSVGPPGSGAQFTSIQAAIVAAQPGDRVFVLPGTYDGAVLVNKAIDLIGNGSSVVTVRSVAPSFPAALVPPMRVTGIGAGARVRISGLQLQTLGAAIVPLTNVLMVEACTGIVELSDLLLQGAGLPTIPATALGGILYVKNCSQVVVSGIQSLGHDQAITAGVTGSLGPERGLAGALFEGSAVLMVDSTAIGNSSRAVTFGYGGDGGDGVLLVNSITQIARSVVRGAQSAGLSNGVAGVGGHGIRALHTFVLLHGGLGNATAGANAFELAASTVMLGTAGNAISLDATSTLIYGADVALSGGTGTTSLPPAPPLSAAPGSIVDARSERLPTVSITPASTTLGSPLTVRLSGQPGFDHIRAVALKTAPATFYPGMLGAVLVDLSAVVIWHTETLDATGNLTISVPTPPDPSLSGLEIVEQCAQALPNGIVISPPVAVTLVP